MRKIYCLLFLLTLSASAVSAQCSDLFFSEYIEGSSSNKALEIYNPTGADVDLTDYVLYRFNNGSLTATDSLFPQGMLLAGDVFVIANSSANASILAQGDTTHTMTFFNGDDQITLINMVSGDTLDAIGEIGVDPGAGWTVGSGATNNFTLVRMIGQQEGETDWVLGATQWDVFPIDMTDSLGTHSMTPCPPASGACTELYFSEYIEGSSSNKALEIYNPTAGSIDLSNYTIFRYNNGATSPSGTFPMTGTLASHDVYVIANSSANATILGASDTTSAITFYNGDDHLRLVNTMTGDTIDAIGELGVDPGAGWTVGSGATNNFTLIRMVTIEQGNIDWTTASMEWDVYPIDMVDSLGMHTSTCAGGGGGPVGPGCSDDIFISEYIEGITANKALELYNPTDFDVDLSDYEIRRYNNGASAITYTFAPQTILASDDVFVVSAANANAAIQAVTDTNDAVTSFTGNDAIELYNLQTGQVIDVIGEVGNDPGTTGWTVGTGATTDQTLIRKFNIRRGETNWVNGQLQWDVFPADMTDSLGMHSMNPCGAPTSVPVLSFDMAQATTPETSTMYSLDVTLMNPDANDSTEVDVVLLGGTATQGTDFTFANTSLLFPAGDTTPQTITIGLTDDLVFEGDETVILGLQSPTTGAVINIGTFTLTIEEDELPTYPIGTINVVDSNGVVDSLGLTCWTYGVVYGVNMRPSGTQFTIIDAATGGIGVFDFGTVSGYVVTEGDSISMLGTVGQFNGLAQINPDSIILHTAGASLKNATPVTTLSESTESDLVVFENATLIDPNQWTGSGSGFNVDITNGTDTITMRVDADVDVYNMPPPAGKFSLCGLGGQFDSSSPYLSGYQLLPRYMADIKPVIELDLGADILSCGSPVMLDAGNPGYTYDWSTGDTTQMITVSTQGTYIVTVSDPNYGMPVSDTINVDPNSAPVAAFGCTSIFMNAYQFTDSSTAADTWMWDFGDGNSSNLQNPTHTYTSVGIFTVTLTATNGCGTDTISKVIDTTVGVEEAFASQVKVWPNPSSGTFQLELPGGLTEAVELRVSDLYGKAVKEALVESGTATVDLQGFARGVYVLELRYLNASYKAKLVLR